MERALVVTGRMIGPTTVELDEPVSDMTGTVEVILRYRAKQQPQNGGSLSAYLRSLPPGTRTKEDVDRQIREERDSWGDR